jgi:hypothetical protein
MISAMCLTHRSHIDVLVNLFFILAKKKLSINAVAAHKMV